MTTTNEDKPAALSAFLSPPSRILNVDAASAKKTAVAPAPVNKLSPEQISLKIASMLKPGPPFYSTVSSADLIDNLGSASIMRCDELQPGFKKDKAAAAKAWLKGIAHVDQAGAAAEEESWTGVGTVWSALNGLPSGAAAFEIPSSHQGEAKLNKGGLTGDDDGLWSSIMFACDLDGSNVELTKSCVVPTKVLTEAHYFKGNYNALFTTLGAGKTYQWDDWSAHATATSNQTSLTSMLTLYTMPSVEMWSWPSWVPYLGQKEDANKPTTPSTPLPPNQGGSKRVWVPSTTKVSVHASWWGYTIYLPSAVLPALEADVDQAEKIAGIVHVVLTTILDKAGSLPLPAALQAAVLLLKAIAPSTSYIATFIGWSWDSIKSFDKGQGVELTATWLLPIALIPHSWDAAIAPADSNGDGTPDGPPTNADAEPTAPVPSGGNSDQTKQPDANPAAIPAPAEPEQPADTPTAAEPAEPIATAPTTEQPPAAEVEAPEEVDQSVSEGQKEVAQDTNQEDDYTPEVPAETSEDSKPVQSLLTLAPDAADGDSLSEEAIQKFAKTPEAATTGQSDTIVEEDELEENVKEEEPKEEEVKEEVEAKEEEEPKGKEEAKDEQAAETVQPTASPSDADTVEPNAPADSTGDTNQGDPLGLGQEKLPTLGDAPAPTPAPENDGIEWQGQAAAGATIKTTSDTENVADTAPKSPSDSTRKLQLKGGARKLFGKMTNKV